MYLVTFPATYNSILNCSLHNDTNSDLTMTSKLYCLIIYRMPAFHLTIFQNCYSLCLFFFIPYLSTDDYFTLLYVLLDLPHTMNNIVFKKTIFNIHFSMRHQLTSRQRYLETVIFNSVLIGQTVYNRIYTPENNERLLKHWNTTGSRWNIF